MADNQHAPQIDVKCHECDNKAECPIKTPSYCSTCIMCPCKEHKRAIVAVDKTASRNQVIAGPLCHYCTKKEVKSKPKREPLPACRECDINKPTFPINAPTFCGDCLKCPDCRVRKRGYGQHKNGSAWISSRCWGCVEGRPPKQKSDEAAARILVKFKQQVE